MIGSRFSRFPIVTVLTDLQDEWHLYWYRSRNEVVETCLLNRTEARSILVEVVRDVQSWDQDMAETRHTHSGGNDDARDGGGFVPSVDRWLPGPIP